MIIMSTYFYQMVFKIWGLFNTQKPSANNGESPNIKTLLQKMVEVDDLKCQIETKKHFTEFSTRFQPVPEFDHETMNEILRVLMKPDDPALLRRKIFRLLGKANDEQCAFYERLLRYYNCV